MMSEWVGIKWFEKKNKKKKKERKKKKSPNVCACINWVWGVVGSRDTVGGY